VTRLTTALVARDGRTILSVSGELDLSLVGELRETIDRLVRASRGKIEVDLSRVTYLDSSAIGVLVAGRHLADQLDKGYQITGACEQVVYVLNTAGVLDYLCRDHGSTSGTPPSPR